MVGNSKKPIDLLVDELEASMKAHPGLERTFKMELERLVRKVYADAITQHKGWCVSFKVPEREIFALMEKTTITADRIKDIFVAQWEVPASAYMVGNPFYHFLSLLILYGVRHRNESISKNAMIIMLVKLWNGRRVKLIPYCNPEVMRYVIANLSAKYHAHSKNNDSPMSLIMNHYTPTILNKYSATINSDSTKTHYFFSQCHNRLRQIFISGMRDNLLDPAGDRKAESGLMALYFKAAKAGLKISAPTTKSGGMDDIESASTEYYTSHSYDDIINDLTQYFSVNPHPIYDANFIQYVNKSTSTKVDQIKIIVNSIHSIKYVDAIRDVLTLMLKQLRTVDKANICSPTFYDDVKKKIISSKHSPTITQLKKVTDLFLEKIFKDKIGYRDYNQYSIPSRGKFRAIVLYAFAHNIQKHICN